MTRKNVYRYVGANGTIDSTVLLPYANYIERYRLTADKNKLLTDGTRKVKIVDIFAMDLEEWYEIDDPLAKND